MSAKLKYLPLFLFLAACVNTDTNPKVLFTFPKSMKELSGITFQDNLLYAIQDSENAAEINAIDLKGNIVNTVQVSNAINNDWEDITSDPDGNLYIGDFGNNNNDRTNLAIYKIQSTDLRKTVTDYTEKTTFAYPDQTDFPPKKVGRYFDAEAFFYYNGNFYLFTKNRSTKNSGFTTLYRIPARPGAQTATLLGKLDTCTDFHSCAITAAAISPDAKRVALLSGANIWLLENFTGDAFLKGKTTKIPLGTLTQKESVCFAGNKKLYIGDERKKKTGGQLYQLDLK